MNRDTRPDGHHGKNNPPKPTKQTGKGRLDTVNNDKRAEDEDEEGRIGFLRELQRQGVKVVIKPDNR